MPVARYFTLPPDDYSGQVWTAEQDIYVSYNYETENYIEGVGDPELKMALEDLSVQAALDGGFDRVTIRSTIHPSTRNSKGERVSDKMHITISASGAPGTASGHVYCTGLAYKRLPPHWYEDLEFDFVRWDYEEPIDAANSTPISTPQLVSDATFDSTGHAQPEPPSPPMRQWVLLPPPRRAPGVEYQWWDGNQFVNKYTSEGGRRRAPTPDHGDTESDDEDAEMNQDTESDGQSMASDEDGESNEGDAESEDEKLDGVESDDEESNGDGSDSTESDDEELSGDDDDDDSVISDDRDAQSDDERRA